MKNNNLKIYETEKILLRNQRERMLNVSKVTNSKPEIHFMPFLPHRTQDLIITHTPRWDY